jgi:NADH:ubiquinone oxidoreductase subunit 5 (subunit L)/multisubunit Na+/H+ antiporter MnhA subunit
VKLCAIRRDASRLRGRLWKFYIRSPEMPSAISQHSHQRALQAFLLNKWYFDELYDFLFVRPAKRLGTFPLEEGRRLRHRRLRA